MSTCKLSFYREINISKSMYPFITKYAPHMLCSSVSRRIHSDWHTGQLVSFCHAAAQMFSLLQHRVTKLIDVLDVCFNLFDNL